VSYDSSQMTVRYLTHEDEPLLASWWIWHGKPIIPAALWPRHALMVDESLAGFLIGTDASFAIIEWYVSKPSYDRIKRREAMKLLTEKLSEMAKQLGYNAVIVIINKGSLVSLFKEQGFEDDASDLISLMRRI
jgi:hypothetical protein